MLSPVSRSERIRKFRSLGYQGPFSGGKHRFMIKGRHKIRIPNPRQKGDIGVPLLREILRQAGITQDDWLNA